MFYVTIQYFEDIQDNMRPYKVGEIYPREGIKVSEERLQMLSSQENNLRTPLITKLIGLPEESEKDEKTLGEKQEDKENLSKLKEMKVDELKKLADEKKIDYDSNIKKADLIQLIQDHEKEE